MTDRQWETLLAVIDGQSIDPIPAGFIVDSPWLPNWAGVSIMDYYASEVVWFETNIHAIRRFPDILFLPGFWAEWGMCTEPSAFGARCIWHEDEFPFAERTLAGLDGVARLRTPDPRTDGLPPFVLKRLKHWQSEIEEAGHAIRFAVARGPLNVAGFLVGNTEFLTAMKMQPDETHALLEVITRFLVDWIRVQATEFPSIDGVFVLDDLAGFCGPDDFLEFAAPYLKRCFEAVDARVRFFHNDAYGLVCAPYLAEISVNLFNFSHNHSMAEMSALVGDGVALLGNIPPRDVLARGAPDDVRQSVRAMLAGVGEGRRIVASCGGGMPPGVSTENIEAFLEALKF